MSIEAILAILQDYHLAGMFLMLLACGFGFPMPEDIILIAGGILAQREGGSIWPSVAVAYAGVIVGDSIMFTIGRRLGTQLLDHKRLRFVFPPSRRARVEAIFQRWGAYAVLAGRFAAGVRAMVFLTAGAMRVKYWLFFVCDSIAAMASVPLFVWLGYKFSQNLDVIMEKLARAKLVAAVVVAVLLVAWILWKFVFKRKAPPPPETPPA